MIAVHPHDMEPAAESSAAHASADTNYLLPIADPVAAKGSFSSSSSSSSNRPNLTIHRLSVSSNGSHGTSSDFDSSWAHDTSPFPSPSPSPSASPPHDSIDNGQIQYPKSFGPGMVQTFDERLVHPYGLTIPMPSPKNGGGYGNLKVKSKPADASDRWSTSANNGPTLSSPTRRTFSILRQQIDRAAASPSDEASDSTPLPSRSHTVKCSTSPMGARSPAQKAEKTNTGYFSSRHYGSSSPGLSNNATLPTRSNFSLPASPNEPSWIHPAAAGSAITAIGMEPRPWHDTPQAWLLYYFFLNLALTLYNKAVLFSFPFPYTLTGIHALCGAAGSYIFYLRGGFVPARLNEKESIIMALFSVLYTVNIAISNVSLQLVTVPFHQVVRAMTPLFTIILAVAFTRKRFGSKTYISLVPVVAGVAFATYGDYYFTPMGLFLTLLGTLLAALKTVVTNAIQVGRLRLHPLDLLLRMSPLAFVQTVIYAYTTGELARVRKFGAVYMTQGMLVRLLINGIIAFFLNVVSFTANKKTSALTMTVAANVKQVLTIVLAVVIFNLTITPTNAVGIMLTLIGGAWYAKIEFQEKTAARKVTPMSQDGVGTPLESKSMLPQVADKTGTR